VGYRYSESKGGVVSKQIPSPARGLLPRTRAAFDHEVQRLDDPRGISLLKRLTNQGYQVVGIDKRVTGPASKIGPPAGRSKEMTPTS